MSSFNTDNEWPLETRMLADKLKEAFKQCIIETLGHLSPPERAVVMTGVLVGMVPSMIAAALETATGRNAPDNFEEQLKGVMIDTSINLLKEDEHK